MNTFKLHPLGDNENYVVVTFSYKEKNNCYDITFDYDFSSTLETYIQKKNIMKNLGLYDTNMDDYYRGDIIFKNSLTTELISYMMLCNENLKTKSGNVSEECYRLSLIKTIQLLWD